MAQSSDAEAQPVGEDDDAMEISDGDMGTEDENLVYFSNCEQWSIGHQFPTTTLVENGIIARPIHPGPDVALVLRQLLPSEVFHDRQKPESPMLPTDQDARGHFGPSRIQPRAAFQFPRARRDIEREITDSPKIEDV